MQPHPTSVRLSPEVKAWLEARAIEAGHGSVSRELKEIIATALEADKAAETAKLREAL